MNAATLSFRIAAAAACFALAACGNYSPDPSQDATPGPTPAPSGDVKTFFAEHIEPRLEFCRGCHVDKGIAAAEGPRMMLPKDPDLTLDYDAFFHSWDVLGRGTTNSRLALKAANVADDRHSGGAAWPLDSVPGKDLQTLLTCWNTPDQCALQGAGNVATELPLLGSMRGGHYWNDFCEGKDDNVELPADPRTLVTPGISDGKAVYMNAFWQTCQDNNRPIREGETKATCGALRDRVAKGYPLIAAAGEPHAGTFFSGDSSSSSYAINASDYENMWQSVWQMPGKPANYDELVAQRWGMPLSPAANGNPYPLASDDPAQAQQNGGSGRLPMGLTQLRNDDGTWTGKLNVTCSICHGGQVGDAADGPGLGALYGTNSLSDITVMFTDLARLTPQQGALAMVSQNKVRGTGNITNFQLFGTLTLSDSQSDPQILIDYLTLQSEASTGTEDPPVWWNGGHRTMKFFDAGQVWDSKRIELSFHFPNTPFHSDMAADKKWITDHEQDGDAWIASRKSPAWPEAKLGTIDVALAEKGAVLFHNKDLWRNTTDSTQPDYNPVAPPANRGNGSCASCHGAYSPRYVNDPAFLADPSLEGIAANIVPIEVINTDTKRLDGNSQRVAEAARSNWFAYSDGDTITAQNVTPPALTEVPLCGDWNDQELRDWNGTEHTSTVRALGYLAPPLYGVWATAPYFHNGSVPDVASVLDPSQRPKIWRRASSTAAAGQEGSVVMGFDAGLGSYDTKKLGWNYQSFACGDSGSTSTPVYDCSPVAQTDDTAQLALLQLWLHGGLAWNLINLPIMSNQQIEDRKVYNTYYYSQANTGHEFTQVLTNDERAAIIEYLKTL